MRITTSIRLFGFLSTNLPSTILILVGLSTFLGLGMGLLISRGEWIYALIMALLIPLAILFTQRILIGVFLYLLLMPLLSVFPNAAMMYQVIHRLLIPLTLFVSIISRSLSGKKYPQIRLSSPELVLGILVLYIPLSLVYMQLDLQAPLRNFYDRILIPLCMYLILRITPIDKKDIKYLQWLAFFIASSQCSIVLIELVAPQFLPGALQSYYAGRAAGSLSNPYVLADVLIFCICILLHAAMNRKSDLTRLLLLSVCGISSICIFLTMERAVWLAAIIVFVCLIVLYPRSLFRLSLVIVVTALILGSSVLAPQFTAAVQRIGQVQQIYARLVASDAMLQMFQIKPVFGWGYDTLNSFISQFYRNLGEASVGNLFVTSHNTYLTLLTELGLIGLLLYLFPLVWWFIRSVRDRSQITIDGTWKRSFLIILWLVILNNFILSNSADMRWFPFDQTLIWMILGLIANIVYPLSQKKQLHHGAVIQ